MHIKSFWSYQLFYLIYNRKFLYDKYNIIRIENLILKKKFINNYILGFTFSIKSL